MPPNILKSIYLIRDGFSTHITEYKLCDSGKKNTKQMKITITQILLRVIIFRDPYKIGSLFVNICMGKTCFLTFHST